MPERKTSINKTFKIRNNDQFSEGRTRKKMVLLRKQNWGQQIFFFVAATKNFAAATKRFVDRTKHFVVVTKYFCYPYFNKWFCWYNKTFYTVK